MKKPENVKEFYEFLIQSGISPDKAKVIASVAAHETANFSSELYRKHNNCFGFRIPKTWSGRCAYDTKSNYSGYINFVDSINDYIDWCNSFVGGINESPTIHVENMKRKGYFEDSYSNYLRGVMYFYRKL